jgi:hypothetical protein
VKTSPPFEEGSLQEKVSLLPGREWCTREGLSRWTEPWSVWQGDPARILVAPPRGAHGRHAAEALCGGLVEGIITMPEAVMMDWTGWSSSIGAVHQVEQKDNS